MSGRQPFVILTGTLNSIFLIANHRMFLDCKKRKTFIFTGEKKETDFKKLMFLQMKMRQ
jgi:hypothetical protein